MNANARIGMGLRISFVSQKIPPMNCRMGCPEWSGGLKKPTWICKTCVQRPVKDVEVSDIIRGKRRDYMGTFPGQLHPLDMIWEEKLRLMNARRERIAMGE